jgi:hypothetical protein
MSLKTGREVGGSRVSFLVNLIFVFPSKEGFGFCFYTPHQNMHRIADQREVRAATDHAVFLCWKL